MNRLISVITVLATALLFFAGYPALSLIGWRSTESASLVTKIHPSSYLFLIAAILGLLAKDSRYRQALKSPTLLLFLVAGIIITIRAIVIIYAGTTRGELSAALVTWISPAFMLIAYRALDAKTLDRIAVGIRAFLVANSLLGIAEQVGKFHLIPDLNNFLRWESRSSGFAGHPLIASLLTGLVIVFLLSTRKRQRFPGARLPELALHAVAMFAFGGRAAMVFTVLVLIVSISFSYLSFGDKNVPWFQKIIPPLMIAVGVALVFAPIPFVDQALERFSNDGGSADTRNAAVEMLKTLSFDQFLTGVDADRREMMQNFFGSPAGIELAWVALVLTYGIIAIIPMLIALPLLLFSLVRQLDRSAFYMTILFISVTAGSLSFGTKSVLISQMLAMMLTLSRREMLRLPSSFPRRKQSTE
jgi:hypothetical protein